MKTQAALLIVFLGLIAVRPVHCQIWNVQSSGTAALLSDVDFVDTQHGWVAADTGRVLRTTDGGVSWIIEHIGTQASLLGVSFVDQRNGWVVGDDGTYRTTDGGLSWQQQNSNRGLNDVCFVDSLNGWIATWGSTILHTVDGGLTWTTQNTGATAIANIDFVDPLHGWGVGGYWVELNPENLIEYETIIRTTNGGETWNLQRNAEGTVLYSVAFQDLDYGCASSNVYTTNGGVSWSNSRNVIPQFVDFADQLYGWAVGFNGVIYRSTDGGATWAGQESGTTNWLQGVDFVDRNHGWAVGSRGTIRCYVDSTGIRSGISVSPVILHYDTLACGRYSARLMKIRNTGASDLTLSALTLPAGFTHLLTLPLIIAPGDSAMDSVTFHPTAERPYTGNVSITSNRPSSPTTVQLTGLGLRSRIVFHPISIAFGTTTLGHDTCRLLTIVNTGIVPLDVLSMTTPLHFTQLFNPPFSIPPHDSLTDSIRFSSTEIGSFGGLMSLVSNSWEGTNTVPLSGGATGPGIRVTPDSLDFGNVAVHAASVVLMRIRNTGLQPLHVSDITVPEGFTSLFTLPLTVPVGNFVTDTILFLPDSARVYSDSLTVFSDVISSPTRVKVSGIGVQPKITVSPLHLTYGSVEVGHDSIQTLIIHNIQENPESLLTVTAINVPAGYLSLLQLPLTVAGGDSAIDSIKFHPTASQLYNGNLTVTSNALENPPVISLSGTGIQATISVVPLHLAFGNVTVGHDSVQLLTIHNTGTAILRVTTMTVPDGFTALFDLPLSIPAADSVVDTIRFNPTAVQAYSGNLVILSNAPTSPNNATLNGTGIPPSSVEDNPDEIPTDFFLSQNYPNPFNPQTTLRFGVPHTAEITVTIFDALGQNIATVCSGTMQPGVHSVTWNGTQWPSGMYFVRMQTDGRTMLRKILLLK